MCVGTFFSRLVPADGAPFYVSAPGGNIDVALANMASSSSFAPPKLPDFILTERLGSGSYATVYKAYRKVGVSWRCATVPLLGQKVKAVLVLDWNLAGRQQRGGGREGGCKEDSEQGIYGEPAHGDRNPQVCTTPAYSSAQGLPGNDTQAAPTISILPSVLAAMLPSNQAL